MSTLPLEDNAVISACGRYRYVLTRQVGPGTRSAAFVMLNPSTADASNDDPTIRRCIGFAQRWRCGRLVVLNLFAFRATDPADLKRAEEPVGPENRMWFDRTLVDDLCVGPVVCGGAYTANTWARTASCSAGSGRSACGHWPLG